MANYAPSTPRDTGGMPKDGYPPAKVALARTNKENAIASSILLLNTGTTEIEVAAIGQLVAGKWLSQAVVDSSVAGTSVISAAGTSNWDFIIPNGDVRRYVVPISKHVQSATQNQTGSVLGANPGNGLFPAVAFKTTAGTGSVLTGEF